mgnify:CR=1 FL=1
MPSVERDMKKSRLCAPSVRKSFLNPTEGQLLKYLPKSDDSSFRGLHLPVLSLAAVPLWDIQYLKALASYGEGLLGRPPEFEMILGQMEVISTMHGGYRDTPEWVSSDTMNQIYTIFLMHAQPSCFI